MGICPEALISHFGIVKNHNNPKKNKQNPNESKHSPIFSPHGAPIELQKPSCATTRAAGCDNTPQCKTPRPTTDI